MISNKKLLKTLDDAIAPGGVIDDKAFTVFFDKYAQDIANINEPEDEDERDAFNDATLKHQAFDYSPPNVQRRTPPWNKGSYDLPSHLIYLVKTLNDEELKGEMLEIAKDIENKKRDLEDDGDCRVEKELKEVLERLSKLPKK